MGRVSWRHNEERFNVERKVNESKTVLRKTVNTVGEGRHHLFRYGAEGVKSGLL